MTFIPTVFPAAPEAPEHVAYQPKALHYGAAAQVFMVLASRRKTGRQ